MDLYQILRLGFNHPTVGMKWDLNELNNDGYEPCWGGFDGNNMVHLKKSTLQVGHIVNDCRQKQIKST